VTAIAQSISRASTKKPNRVCLARFFATTATSTADTAEASQCRKDRLQRRRQRREKEKGLLTARWKAEQEEFSELPLYKGLADAFDLAGPDLWRSNTFASLRPRLISYVEHAIAVLEFQSGSRYGSIFLAPREAERRLQRAREILQLLKPEDRR
jgi:hypothetical protein